MDDDLAEKLLRIGPAARSPRADEQHPYAPRPGHEAEDVPAIRQELDEYFRENLPLVKSVVKERLGFLSPYERDDFVSEITLHLIERSLQRYDQTRATKLSTYIRLCSNRHLTGVIRKHLSRKERSTRGVKLDADYSVVAPDQSHDREIEALADRIIAEPDEYLRPAAARLVKDVIEHPDSRMYERSARLGYAQPSSVSMSLTRAIQQLEELVEEVA